MTGDLYYTGSTTTASPNTVGIYPVLGNTWVYPMPYPQINPQQEKEMDITDAVPRKKTFWMIFDPNYTGGMPKKRYDSEEEARAAAQSIAKKNESHVYLLKAVGIVELEGPPTKWSSMEEK